MDLSDRSGDFFVDACQSELEDGIQVEKATAVSQSKSNNVWI
jgi:hypothetical protein